jgi:elongator complex protein 2
MHTLIYFALFHKSVLCLATEPPVEEHLLQNSLWPEVQKLYGHGFELYAVASSPQGNLVASASKATKQEYAAIRLWDTSSWKQVGVLPHHTLTVTQLAFSSGGDRLLAVSRDRCWSLWKQLDKKENGGGFQLEAHIDKSHKSHSRIIWSCSWSPDDVCFFTASRDKKVFVWSRESGVEGVKDCGNGWKMAADPHACSEPITAISVAPVILEDNSYLVAVGLETGEVLLYTFKLTTGKWLPFGRFEDVYGHSDCVKRLQWQPVGVTKINSLKNRVILLASCCASGSVRLHSLKF